MRAAIYLSKSVSVFSGVFKSTGGFVILKEVYESTGGIVAISGDLVIGYVLTITGLLSGFFKTSTCGLMVITGTILSIGG